MKIVVVGRSTGAESVNRVAITDDGATPAPLWNRTGALFNLAVTVLDVGVSIVAFTLAREAGAADTTAYLVAAVGPLLGGVAVWVRAKRLSGASIAVFVFNALSALAALVGSQNPGMLLYKDAVVTGLIGLIFAGSLACPRPLAFYFGQRFATDGTKRGMQTWTGMWQYREFRLAHYAITAVWAVTYLLEAAGKALVIHSVAFDAAYVWTQVLPWAATATATASTIAIARHYSRR